MRVFKGTYLMRYASQGRPEAADSVYGGPSRRRRRGTAGAGRETISQTSREGKGRRCSSCSPSLFWTEPYATHESGQDFRAHKGSTAHSCEYATPPFSSVRYKNRGLVTWVRKFFKIKYFHL